jgi:sulfide dehydrogenase [flavocytochrome c] flavoprotein subunit
MMSLKRRTVLAGAGLALPFLSRPALAASARVVIVGGGFAGASLARALNAADPAIAVALVEPNATYTACPMSNQVIAGLRPIAAQRFTYDKLPCATGSCNGPGISVFRASAIGVDPLAHRVTLSGNLTLDYDRLVLAPGIDFDWKSLPGSSAEAAEHMPHAWKAGAQTELLGRQLAAMEDGGTVVMTVPEAPYRCPPAPYERASLIAHYLKTHKPRSKLIVLDAKEQFSSQKLFEAAWERLYQGIITRVPPSQGGKPASVDADAMVVKSDFDSFKAAVANVIPPQRAGRIASLAGVTDRSLWCPIDPVSFESRLQPRIHVIGDAAIGGALPKSAAAAQSQAQACARAILHAVGGRAAGEPRIESACYTLVAPKDGFSVVSAFRPAVGMYAEIAEAAHVTNLDASPAMRAEEAARGEVWFRQLTRAAFG